jgi:HK97 family phage portal protein
MKIKIIENFKKSIKALTTRKTNKDQLVALLNFLGLQDTDKSELSEATYFACLKVLSETLGKLPLKLLKHNENNGVTVCRTHPLYRVLNERPNKFMTATTFWSTVEYNRNHHGNAYVLINTKKKSNKVETSLWVLPSDCVEIWYDDAKKINDIPDIYYRYSCTAGTFTFGSEEILHFKTSSTFDGITGMSVRERLKSTIIGNNKAQELVNQMYDNGFTAKAVVQYTSSLSDENAKEFAKGIEKFATGKYSDEELKNIIPIPLGATLTPLNIKLADNQFIEVKKYSALQIASAFGIKPYQIGDYEKSSYSSAEAQQLSFYIDTMLYIIKQYEEEISYKLLSDEEESEGYHFKFNVAVILRADQKTQVETLSKGVSNFIYTPNEARAFLDLEAKEGGDRLLGNGASIPVEYTGAQYINNFEGEEGKLYKWIQKTIKEALEKTLQKA